MDDKIKIQNYAVEKFLKEGFYKISMDEIASELGMSKKTIYKYFPSKEKLVEEVVLNFREEVRSKIIVIIKSNDNAVFKIVNLIREVGKVFVKVNEKMIVDLQKHLPVLWTGIDEFRTKQISEFFSSVIEQGKKEGLITDLPIEIIMAIHLAAVRAVVNPTFIMNNKFSFKEAMEYTFKIILNGILTDKGKEIFNTSINGMNQ
jgi:AcrR family transcriptional regulator